MLCGTSLKNQGVQPLIDAVVSYLPSPLDVPPIEGIVPTSGRKEKREPTDDAPFAALAFKVASDANVDRIVYCRIYSGTLGRGNRIYNVANGKTGRITRICRCTPISSRFVIRLMRGHCCACGAKKHQNRRYPDTPCTPDFAGVDKFSDPVISVAIEPRSERDKDKLEETLQLLMDEDPTFTVTIDSDTGQRVISGMGELHLEILTDRMIREFGVNARVSKLQVAYRETITRQAGSTGKIHPQDR